MQAIKNKRSRNKKLRDAPLFVFGVLAWPIIHFCIYSIGMNFSMLIKSFQSIPFGETTGSFSGLENYVDVIKTFLGLKATSGILQPQAILNSLSILPIAVLIDMPISLLFSYIIYKKYFAPRFYQIILFIPTIISAVVLCLVFNMALSYRGVIPQAFNNLGLGGLIPASGFMGDPETAWGSILIFSIWTGISLNLIYFCSAMGRLPQSIIESANLDGASDIRQFFTIVVPLIWGTIVTISITGVASIFSWYLPSLLLTNGQYDTSTLGLIVMLHAKNLDHVGWTSALGVLIAVLGTLTTLGIKRVLEKVWKEIEY